MGYKRNVEDYYQSFVICIFPGRGEGFGISAVEAYLFGISVLGLSDSGGLCEVINSIEPENLLDTEQEVVQKLYYSNNKDEIELNKNKIIRLAKNVFNGDNVYKYHSIYKS